MNRELTDPRDIKSKTLPQLQEELAALGLPKYRAQQVYRWLHRGVTDFSQMSDLSRTLRRTWPSGTTSPGPRWSASASPRTAR